jgi:hypothetical protein
MRGGFSCPEDRRKNLCVASVFRPFPGLVCGIIGLSAGAWRAVRCRACRCGGSRIVGTMAAVPSLAAGAVPGARVWLRGRP